MKQINFGEKKLYFVGEKNQPFTEIIVSEDTPPGKMVAFYVYGDEICGFMTYGYTNLHLYLHEAMKQMVMPSASMMRKQGGDFQAIVAKVLAMAPHITCDREGYINTLSITKAEFTREIEELDNFRSKVNSNIRTEKQKIKDKIDKLKEKYESEKGAEFRENENDIGREGKEGKENDGNK